MSSDHSTHYRMHDSTALLIPYQKKPSLFNRLARHLRTPSETDNAPAVPPKSRRALQKLHHCSPAFVHTPDWMEAPLQTNGDIPARSSPPSSTRSTCTTKSRRRRRLSKAANAISEGSKRTMSVFGRSSVNLPRSESVLSFASADAFTKAPNLDGDSGCFSLSPTSPRSPYEAELVIHRRARSNSDLNNQYHLPSSRFGSPCSPTFSRYHRPKTSESSMESMDTVESEILMTTQMVDSANQAVRSRPPSVRVRRSFETSVRSGGDRDWAWI